MVIRKVEAHARSQGLAVVDLAAYEAARGEFPQRWGELSRSGSAGSISLSFGLFQAKLALVALVLALSVVHDFVLGPRANLAPTPALRVRASWIARVTLLTKLPKR